MPFVRFCFLSCLFSVLFLLVVACVNGPIDPNKNIRNSGCDPKKEIQQAFTYLNQVRQDPSLFGSDFGLDLDDTPPRPAFKWSVQLALSAQNKAEDMAKRNYSSHVDPDGFGPDKLARDAGYALPGDWGQNPSDNHIESLVTGICNGVGAIRTMIIDHNVNPPGHRIQLLGLNEFFAKHVDIGIGMTVQEKSTYKSYLVVHTAYQSN